jgi:hypothetical protein
MKFATVAAVMGLVLLLGAAPAARADVVLTGTYSLGPGNDGNQATGSGNGPFTLTSTNSTFSYVEFLPNQSFTFANLTSLFADFTSNSGGSGGGSPRISVGLNNGGTEDFLHVYLGNSPNFHDSDAVLNTWSGVNLIGNNDPGRYDTAQFMGGSPFTTYAAALALVGGLQVEEIDMVSDTYGQLPSRNLTLDAIGGTINDPDPAIPEPSTMALLGLGGAALAGWRRWKRRK